MTCVPARVRALRVFARGRSCVRVGDRTVVRARVRACGHLGESLLQQLQKHSASARRQVIHHVDAVLTCKGQRCLQPRLRRPRSVWLAVLPASRANARRLFICIAHSNTAPWRGALTVQRTLKPSLEDWPGELSSRKLRTRLLTPSFKSCKNCLENANGVSSCSGSTCTGGD